LLQAISSSAAGYDNNPNNVQVGQVLPPNCQITQAGCNGKATNNGAYPYAWNNDLVDGSFGITSKIVLDQYTPGGTLINSLIAPNSSQTWGPTSKRSAGNKFLFKVRAGTQSVDDGTYLTFYGLCFAHRQS